MQNAEVASELPDLSSMLGSVPTDHTADKFNDAMEHVLEHVLFSTNPPPLNVPDAVDSLCAKSVLVETAVTRNTDYVLVKPQIEEEIKPCSIKLTRIDSVLSYVPKQNLCQTLMHASRPHTRSMCTPKPSKRGRRQKASLRTVSYKEPDTTSEEEAAKKKQSVRPKPKPGTDGPSEEQISSQNNKTVHPTQRILVLKSDTPVTSSSNSDNSDADTEIYDQEGKSENTTAPKGAFKITVRSLKKAMKYNCKYCDSSYDSSKKLTDHHQKCRKILYCNLCN